MTGSAGSASHTYLQLLRYELMSVDRGAGTGPAAWRHTAVWVVGERCGVGPSGSPSDSSIWQTRRDTELQLPEHEPPASRDLRSVST